MNQLQKLVVGKTQLGNGALNSLVITVIRIVTGILLAEHGAQKIFQWKFAGTKSSFTEMGVPVPGFSAIFAMVAEFGGGIMLILGLFPSAAAVLNIINLLGAIFTFHIKHLSDAENSRYALIDSNVGIELPILYILLLLAILIFDSGKLGLNRLFR